MRELQKTLAREITCMIHSEEEYRKAVEASGILFGNATADALRRIDERTFLQVFDGVPQFEVAGFDACRRSEFHRSVHRTCVGFPVERRSPQVIREAAYCSTKRRLPRSMRSFRPPTWISGKYLLVQKGKKNYFLIVVK